MRGVVLAGLAGLAVAFWSAGAAAAPSFDCARASTPTEHAICGAPALAALDRALADAYRAARTGAGEAERARIRAEQIAWLGRRDACGADAACLEARMAARLAALRGGGTAGSARRAAAGLSGVYCAREGADALVVEVRGARAAFALSSWQGGGHHCGTGTLTARRANGAFVAQDRACTLRLFRSGGSVVLEAGPFEACKAQYCGARAAMGRFAFPAGARRPLPAPLREIRLMEDAVCR